jgi:hypothetical protein
MIFMVWMLYHLHVSEEDKYMSHMGRVPVSTKMCQVPSPNPNIETREGLLHVWITKQVNKTTSVVCGIAVQGTTRSLFEDLVASEDSRGFKWY